MPFPELSMQLNVGGTIRGGLCGFRLLDNVNLEPRQGPDDAFAGGAAGGSRPNQSQDSFLRRFRRTGNGTFHFILDSCDS